MNKKIKGQGALEYLLLIGGAVLIAVIVIALLVGMGGQSRDTATEQGERAQQATDIAQPAQITGIESFRDDCVDTPANAKFSLSWVPVGDGGVYELIIKDSRGNILDVSLDDMDTNDLDPIKTANVTGSVNINSEADGNSISPANNCGDTFTAVIKTTKNQQTVNSQSRIFRWSN